MIPLAVVKFLSRHD